MPCPEVKDSTPEFSSFHVSPGWASTSPCRLNNSWGVSLLTWWHTAGEDIPEVWNALKLFPELPGVSVPSLALAPHTQTGLGALSPSTEGHVSPVRGTLEYSRWAAPSGLHGPKQLGPANTIHTGGWDHRAGPGPPATSGRAPSSPRHPQTEGPSLPSSQPGLPAGTAPGPRDIGVGAAWPPRVCHLSFVPA